jgi:3-dehydroquinate dehydratase-2
MSAQKRILVINGANLNLTGFREPEVYGTETLDEINAYILKFAESIGVHCEFFQSNSEGALVDAVQRVLFDGFAGGVINPGAYSYYSYVLRDAIVATKKPFAEVHMSNIYEREAFRRNPVIKEACAEMFCGEGKESYIKAVSFISGITD